LSSWTCACRLGAAGGAAGLPLGGKTLPLLR